METHNKTVLAIIEIHKKAAQAHQEAAKAHIEAVKYHAGGNGIQANESAKTAKEHGDWAAVFDKQLAERQDI